MKKRRRLDSLSYTIVERVEKELSKRVGANVLAKGCVERAIRYFKQGHSIKAIKEATKSSQYWFQGDSKEDIMLSGKDTSSFFLVSIQRR